MKTVFKAVAQERFKMMPYTSAQMLYDEWIKQNAAPDAFEPGNVPCEDVFVKGTLHQFYTTTFVFTYDRHNYGKEVLYAFSFFFFFFLLSFLMSGDITAMLLIVMWY